MNFVNEEQEAALSGLFGPAREAAGWPAAVTRGLAWVVHGLCVARKSRRQLLPQALATMEALLHAHDGAAASEAPPPPPALLEEEEAAAAGEGAAGGRNGGLTRLVGQLDRLAVEGGGDAALVRLRITSTPPSSP